MNSLPTYINRRLRLPQPPDCGIVSCATPVLSFGALRSAWIATLGLNPSRAEFLDRNGAELIGARQRFETLSSLELSTLEFAPTDKLEHVVRGCDNYFHANPYRQWFDRLEPILQAAGASYYDGSACHLDLVQWATDPTWRGLSRTARKRLMADDVPFLAAQLASSRLRLLLLNGRAVVDAFGAGFQVPFEEIDRVAATRIFAGRLGGLELVGWSTNIQSSFGVTRVLRSELALRVRDLAQRAANGSRVWDSGSGAAAIRSSAN